MAAELPLAALVGPPDAGVADAGEVAPDDELDRDRLALDRRASPEDLATASRWFGIRWAVASNQ
jgi:hypothetical protein